MERTTTMISVWNNKDMEFVETGFLLPSFVLDVNDFTDKVQKEHIESTSFYLIDRWEKAQEAVTTISGKLAKVVDSKLADELQKKLEKAQDRLSNAHKEMSAFQDAVTAENFGLDNVQPDAWSQLYCIGFGLNRSFTTNGFDKSIYEPIVVPYVNQYDGCMAWSQGRKDSFSKMKKALNELIKFSTKDVSGDLYKSFSPEYSSEAVNRFIRKACPVIKKKVLKTEDGDFAGFALDMAKAKTCFTYAMMELFYKYGCDVPVKANKQAKSYRSF